MGKQGKQPRTKGGLKPASSSRAAELATNAGTSLSFASLGGFAQFAGVTTPGLSIPSSAVSDMTDLTLDVEPDLVVIMKKLSKREAITKLKALEELEEYLKEKPTSALKILPSWTRAYARLALDVDRRVRLATSNVHLFIVSSTRKKYAPRLKETIGVWMIAMHDHSKDVAKIAKTAFDTLFPPEKRKDAILYCQKEIIEYMSDILLEKTPDTLSDTRYVNEDDRIAKYARVISSSLKSISFLLEELSEEERSKVQDQYNELFYNPGLWKHLSSKDALIRKAMYSFLKSLVLYWKEMIFSQLEILCPLVFTAVFNERDGSTHSAMWDVLLLITKEFPQSWTLASKKPILPKLCNFLRSGLNGSPDIAYAGILPLLASIPQELISTTANYEQIMSSFWKGLSSNVIDKTGSLALLKGYEECILYFTTQQCKNEDRCEDTDATISYLVDKALWTAIESSFVVTRDTAAIHYKLDPSMHIATAKYLRTITLNPSTAPFIDSVWKNLAELLVDTLMNCRLQSGCTLDMKSFCDKVGDFLVNVQSVPVSQEIIRRVIITAMESSLVHKPFSPQLLSLINTIVNGCSVSLIPCGPEDVIRLCHQFPLIIKDGPPEALKPLVSYYMAMKSMYPSNPNIANWWTDFIVRLKNEDQAQGAQAVHSILHQMVTKDDNGLSCLELDSLIQTFAIDVLSRSDASQNDRSLAEQSTALALSLHSSHGVLADEALSYTVQCLETSLTSDSTLHEEESQLHVDTVLVKREAAISTLRVLDTIAKKNGSSALIEICSPALICSVFDAMFTKRDEFDEIPHQASLLWDTITQDTASIQTFSKAIINRISQSISDIGCVYSPTMLVEQTRKLLATVFRACSEEEKQDVVDHLIGIEHTWKDEIFPFTQCTSVMLTLSVFDPKANLGQPSFYDEDELLPTSYDVYGLSSYARRALYVTEYIVTTGVPFFFDNSVNHTRDQVLIHLMVTSMLCHNGLLVHGLCRLWDNENTDTTLAMRSFVSQMRSITNQWLDNRITALGKWPDNLLNVLTKPPSKQPEDRLVALVASLVKLVDTDSSITSLSASNILSMVLKRIIRDLDIPSDQAQTWLPLVRESTCHLLIKVTIFDALKSIIAETKGFRHLQSKLMSDLSSFNSMSLLEDEESLAWRNLVLLNSTSTTFGFLLPHQQLLYLVKTFSNCIGKETEQTLSMDRRNIVFTHVAILFKNMAEGLCDVPAKQWELFSDQCYEWIAYSDPNIDGELPLIFHSLKLYQTLQHLEKSADDEHLRRVMKSNAQRFYTILLELICREYDLERTPTTLGQCRCAYQEMLADLLENIPDRILLEYNETSQIFQLLQASNDAVQKRGYILSSRIVASQVRKFSADLEFTETSDEDDIHVKIHNIIMDCLVRKPHLSEWHSGHLLDKSTTRSVSGYLISWLLMFRHFEDITFKLKQEFTVQLKKSSAVELLLSCLFHILDVGVDHAIPPFDISAWDIETYHIEDFDSSHENSFLLLAAHLFYLALKHLPSLTRTWWVDCKNRRLSIAVESYTEKYYSSTLIHNEFALVNRPDVRDRLQGDSDNDFITKTIKSTNEVTATYTVDGQRSQIVIKLPGNYPLRQIDVEGTEKVGISDKQWRGWIFAIAAMMTSQNGSIVDALTVFKRNMKLHFEGIEDCTICYSIISVQDRTIPTKQCRTCKNKFHASCLYKWFRTSNSASCPLCRTVF